LNKVWKEILKPRFERLQNITGEPLIIFDETDRNKFNFTKEYKRVDHRHHALDALIIAATTREHIKYLNTLNAADDAEKRSLQFKLVKNGIRDFVQPWPKFTEEAKGKLDEIIVSHKAINRVVTKPFNRYLKWVEKDGAYRKEFVKQQQPKQFDKNWSAIRRSMFKEPQGVIYLKNIVSKKINDAIAIQINAQQSKNKKGAKPADYIYDQSIRPLIKSLIRTFKGDLIGIKTYLKKNPLKDSSDNLIEKVSVAEFAEYAAKRVALDASFDEKKISKIPYASHIPSDGKHQTLSQILKMHLEANEKKPEIAFMGEGMDMLHKKLGYPLKKVTIYEAKDPETKFKGKYYETDKGGNVFFVIVLNEHGERTKMYTLPLMEAIERLVNKIPLADTEHGESFFTLSPNELVYVPEEGENIKAINWNDKKLLFDRVYKMTDTTQGKCLFMPHFIAKNLGEDGVELGSGNKSQRAWNGTVEYRKNSKGNFSREDSGTMIKDVCIKLKVDRLGNVTPA